MLANDFILSGLNTNLVITSFTTNNVLGTLSLNSAHTRLIYKPSNLGVVAVGVGQLHHL